MKSKKNYILILMLLLASSMSFAQNNALLFHGNETDNVSIENETALNPTAAVTVEAWINASSWRNAIHEGTILGNEDNSSGSAGYILRTGDGGDIQFNLGMGSNWRDARTNDNPLNTGTWYHVAGVFDGATIKVYIDGVEVATTTQSGTISVSTKNLEIGRLDLYHSRYFDGKIDEVRVWNVAIDEATLLAWKDIPVTDTHPNHDNLVSYFELNDDTDPLVAVPTVGTEGTVTGAEYIGYSLTCSGPSDLEALNITTTSADLAWTESGSATAWDIEWGAAGFTTTGIPTEAGITSNPFSISTLSSSNNYEFYVRSSCGVDDASEWAGPFAFATLATCPVPTALGATDITSSSATLVWSSGGASNYNFVYGPEDFDMEDSIYTLHTDTFIVLSDLMDDYSYEFYIRDSCGEEDKSFWVGPYAFTTECGSAIPDYIEDFSSYIPGCWEEAKGELADPTVFTSTTSSNWIADGFANSGTTGAAKMNIYYTDKFEWLISKPIDLGETNDMQLEFDLAYTSWNTTNPPNQSGDDDKFAIVISTDNGATWNLSDALRLWDNTGSEFVINDISNSGDHIIIDLSAYTGVVKIGLYAETTVSNADNDLSVDNFRVRVAPTCNEPTALTTSNITAYTADLSWIEQGTATTWNIEVVESGTPATGEPTMFSVTNPYTYEGLSSTTTYEYYVQSDCGEGDLSLMSGPYSFTTDISCYAPTALTLYDYTATTATFTWITGGSSNWNIEYGEDNFVQGTGTFLELEDTFYTIEGLTPETTYEFYVQDSCGLNDESLWTGPISVTTTSTCPQPIDLTASPMDITATLSWNGFFAANWDIVWGETGFTNDEIPMLDNITEPSQVIDGLTPETAYEFYVRADCGSDNTDVSTWAGPFSFTTTMTPLSNPTECGVGFAETGGCIEIPILVSDVAATEVIREFHLINPHVWDGDLNISLESPEGITVDLSSGNGSSGDNYGISDGTCTQYTAFNMYGTDGSITAGSPPYVGSYIPEGDFSEFNTGADLNGVWTLHICDTYASSDDGEFEFAELVFEEGLSDNDILTFEFAEQTDVAVIDPINHTVEIYVDYGTDMTNIVPTFTLSDGAQTNQTAINFTSPVIYSIIAENNDLQDWTVTVLETAPSTENDIITFSIPEQTPTEVIINAVDHTVSIEVSNATLTDALIASFEISTYATINVAATDQVSGVTPNAFVYDVAFEYNVVAQNGDIQIWEVTVTQADLYTDVEILAYAFPEQAGPAVIDSDAKTISIDVHPCVDLMSLVATYELSFHASSSINGIVQESAVTANDFTLPVIDTVTAEDGTTIGIWTITVNQLSPIMSDYPYLEDFEGNFLPFCWTKELPGGSTPNDIIQTSAENHTESGEFSVRFSSYSTASDYNQFLTTETFNIDPMYSELSFWHRKSNSAADELTFGIATATDTTWTTINLELNVWNQEIIDLTMYNGQDIFFIYHYYGNYLYYVYIDDLSIKQSENTDITVYDVPGQLGTTEIVSESDSIQVIMPFGTAWPITFAAEFELFLSDAEVATVAQASTVTENTWVDNLTPVVYTVTAQDGTIREWSVYVDVALNPAKEILTYSIEGQDVDTPAEIDAANAEIHVTMPIGTTSFTDLLATFTLSDDATAAIAGTDQVSAVTLNTWTTAPLVYTVTAEDGTTKDWSVYVTASLSSENEILTFEIDGQILPATIPDPANPIIDIVMPAGTPNLSGLTATFTLSEAATATVGTNPQVSGTTINNWSTGTVVYNVAAENGTVKEWTINVSIAPFSGTDILSYTINGQEGLTEYMPENDSIHIYMLPTVTSISDRAANFTLSEGATAQVDGIDQVSGTTQNDFTNSGNIPVIYTVTAGDGTERNWKVVVDLTVGVDEIVESKDINVYPNPNNGLFELAINIANLKTVSLEVINTQGQVVSTLNEVNTNVAQSIDLSELATGVYYIKVITEKETMVKKVNILK